VHCSENMCSRVLTQVRGPRPWRFSRYRHVVCCKDVARRTATDSPGACGCAHMLIRNRASTSKLLCTLLSEAFSGTRPGVSGLAGGGEPSSSIDSYTCG